MKEDKLKKRTNKFIDVVINLLKEKQKKGYDLEKTIKKLEEMKV